MKRYLAVLLLLLAVLAALPTVSADDIENVRLNATVHRAADSLSVTVTVPDQDQEALLICAVYDTEGKLLETVGPLAASGVDAPIAFVTNAGDAALVKAFLLDSQTWAPCCAAAQSEVPVAPDPGENETEEVPLW